MPLKIREINLSLPSAVLTFLLWSTVCQSHLSSWKFACHKEQRHYCQIGLCVCGGSGSTSQHEGKEYTWKNPSPTSHTLLNVLQDWTWHAVSLCVCVCLNSPSVTRTCARLCTADGNTTHSVCDRDAACSCQSHRHCCAVGIPHIAANSIHPNIQWQTSNHLILNLA